MKRKKNIDKSIYIYILKNKEFPPDVKKIKKGYITS